MVSASSDAAIADSVILSMGSLLRLLRLRPRSGFPVRQHTCACRMRRGAPATNTALVVDCPPMAPGLPIVAPGELRHAQPPGSLAASGHPPRGAILWGRSRAIKFMLRRWAPPAHQPSAASVSKAALLARLTNVRFGPASGAKAD